MKLLTQVSNVFKRATEGTKNLASLNIDQQYSELDKQLAKERLAEAERIRNAYPHGWFKMTGHDGSHILSHWCPDCKTLSQGKVAIHCGSRKRENRPEGWRLAFLPKTTTAIFI